MATLETLDILFKSSGKSDILKDINDIEKRWSDITKNVVENIQKIVELRKELSNVNDLTKETVDLIEKEALAKKSVVNEEKKLEKIKNRGLAQQGRNEKQREKTEKQREMAEKARDKANRSERGGGSSSSGGGTFWGNLGGLSSFLNLGMDFVKAGFTAVKTITGWAMEHGQIGVAVKRISEGQNEEAIQTVLSDLVRSGWARGVSQGTVISAVSQLRQQFDEAFNLGKAGDFFDKFALGGAKFEREDFLGFLNSILRPKNAQQTTALRSALSPELAEAFLSYKDGTGSNLYKNIDSSIEIMGNLTKSLEGLKNAIVTKFAKDIETFTKEIELFVIGLINFLDTPDGEALLGDIKNISETLGKMLLYIIDILGFISSPYKKKKMNEEAINIAKNIAYRRNIEKGGYNFKKHLTPKQMTYYHDIIGELVNKYRDDLNLNSAFPLVSKPSEWKNFIEVLRKEQEKILSKPLPERPTDVLPFYKYNPNNTKSIEEQGKEFKTNPTIYVPERPISGFYNIDLLTGSLVKVI